MIPVAGNRKIVGAAFSPELHAVSFSDGVMEWMAPKTEKKWTMKINGGVPYGLRLDSALAYILLTGENIPRAISLESIGLVR